MKNNKMKTVFFVDQTSEGDHHMVFNSSMIKILLIIFNEASVVHVGIQSNQKSTQQLLDKRTKKRVVLAPIVYPVKKYTNTFLKVLNYTRKEYIRVKNFYSLLRKTNGDDVIVLSITTFTSFLCFKILKLFFKSQVLCVLHGDLDFVYNAVTFYEKVNGIFHRIIFKLKVSNFYYIVLNKIAKSKLVEDAILKSEELLEIDHPFNNLDQQLKPKEVVNNFPVQIGHIGSLEVTRKNSHLIYKLGEQFKFEIENKKLQLKAIGLCTPGLMPYKNKWVVEIVGNVNDKNPQYLSRNIYENELSTIHYAVFFYSPNQYVFRASGAIADAIAKSIPLIVFEHPYFNYLFKIAGDIGFICKDLDEMQQLITSILIKDKNITDRFVQQVENMKKLHNIMSVSYIAKDLQKQLIKYHILKTKV